ncbi:AAA family ATPase [Phormidium sp. LEGE 05292]|uniref:trifunctional serine/threonine-protein kinase/ATP-binding protein/sensor histidine kinase n=1 Tax=[Phormidium] sp. LEGE 05292 TaxID=767427 RepID=UPI00187FD3BF|nr:ATP-binding sensor histidine kinase [Phormidium sp. LEGE 05292]MBE9224620.1 AAA family ATPase [Phormidium sp. LEGE 05292]
MIIDSNNLLGKYYLTEELYAGDHTLVYRGVSVAQNTESSSVIVKFLRQEYPSFNDLLQFRNQYTIAKNLDIAGIVRPYRLENYRNSYVLVMEDFGGISLRDYIKKHKLSLQEVLEIAQKLAATLHQIHYNRIIHKDIKPANIIINPDTKEIKLIDFSIASLLPKETQEIKNPNNLEGTLAYLAPEQTGRMNRGIDYRTDFYALGVTLFELLTGKLPFEAEDPMDLLHCHLAQQSPEIHNINPEIPTVISAIVNKLMAKNAEDRYQTALGLKHDLENCLNQLKATGKIAEFALGKRDISDRFIIPEKLYGREQEVKVLLDAFDRVVNGSSEMMLVAGFSGIGKTAVVNEVHKPITRQKGYFIKGKFDQFNRNIPFSAFVQALRELMGQLLSESDRKLAEWRNKILTALGDNGQVLIEVIPELERVIGQQHSAPKLSGTAAQNRFNLLFQKFINVFTDIEHPLVIFLDDLQWADSASLQLVKLLMEEHQYLLLLGAYRDNEVSPVHPFILTVEELEKAGKTVNTMTLKPLSFNDTNQLVADTLCCGTESAYPLTELILRKTQGNPFFTTQFLKALHEDGQITFNSDRGYWECDLTRINALSLTGDVVEFMAIQLQKLPGDTQEILKLAACIGNSFDLNTLAIICEQTQTAVSAAIWRALQEGLVIPQSQVYKFYLNQEETNGNLGNIDNVQYRFLHDRVQQAAYSLIPEDRKQITHLKIGQLLLQGLTHQQQVEEIFNLVNQLNLGRFVISSQEQKQQLAQLNLQAGQKAKISAAYQAAQNYCAIGIELLPKEAWQTDYQLIYKLYCNGSEAAYLYSNFEQAEALYATAIVQAQTPLDKAVIYRIQMTQYQLQGRNAEAIAIQRQSLKLLGWTVPETPESIQSSLDEQIETVNKFLEQQTIESILELPKMEDAIIAEMLRILQVFFYAAWLNGESTLALLALAKMTTLSLEYGNSDMSPFGYVGYGLIVNALLKKATLAYQFGNIAVQLCEQFDNADVRGMTNFLFAADVHSWSRPLQEANTYYENAFKYGMEAGNWLTVSFMMMQSGSDRLTAGKQLDELYAIAKTHADFLHQIKSLDNLDALLVGVLQPIRHLLGLTKTIVSFDDDGFSETEFLQKYGNTPYHLAWFYSVKIRHAYLFDQPATYTDLIPKLSIIENTISSHAKVPSSVFYVALMHIALIEMSNDELTRQSHWQALASLEEKLERWQEDCPANIRHKYLLLQAEKARLDGRKVEAIDFYEQAIAIAKTQNYIYEEALANELAAKFCLNWDKEKFAAGYMQEAYYCYARWGAKAKTDHLETRYSLLLQPILEQQKLYLKTLAPLTTFTNFSLQTITQSSHGSNTTISDALDFTSVLKAAQSISSNIELDELLEQLTQIILQNSGADQCILLFPTQNQWQVRAITTPETTKLLSESWENYPHLPIKLIQYVKNTQEVLVMDNLKTDLPVIDDYLDRHQPKSVLCLPILNQGKLGGILYLQNQAIAGVFTPDRLLVVNFLCTQAAISLQNAQLYRQAQQALHDLKQAQLQIIQSEKMSALGNLIAGVAHEINNPLGFISGNLMEAKTSLTDLIEHLNLYREKFSATPEIEDHEEEIDLAYTLTDLPKILSSMQVGCDRIKNISTSLRVFSRADTNHKVSFDLHSGIESTLLILKHRLKANDQRPEIQVIKEYGNLPEIQCFPGQLNQVFMNILANAIDMFDEMAQAPNFNKNNPQSITIKTELLTESNQVAIRIADNGLGIAEEIRSQIFDYLFTTKRVGKGTGLGLAIARQIVVEKHDGSIHCYSQLGEGTEFIINLPI